VTDFPETYPATGADEAVSITRLVTHQRIGVDLKFDGRLDADRLARAMRLSLDAQPVLGTALEQRGRHLAWSRMPRVPEDDLLEVRSSSNGSGDTTAFQAREIPDAGPQAGAILVREEDGDRLGLKVSHVLADGQGAKQYAYLVAELYSRLCDDPDYRPQPDVRPRPTAKDAWQGLSRKQRAGAARAKSWSMPTWVIPGSGSTGGGLTYVSGSLDPDTFRAMKAWGKDRGATVNDVMLSSYFRSCVAEFAPPAGIPLSIMCTADHRRFLPSRDIPISNISISGSLDIESVPGETFEATVGRVKERMAVWADQCYGLGPARMAERMRVIGYGPMKRLMTMALTGGRKPKGDSGKPSKSYPFFTNIGVLDEDRLDFGGVRPVGASMYGPSARGASSVAVVSTYRDELTVRMGFCAHDCDPEMVRRVLDGTLRELRAGTSAPSAAQRNEPALS
jgi:NRPS condensation-like uncharacterized protein